MNREKFPPKNLRGRIGRCFLAGLLCCDLFGACHRRPKMGPPAAIGPVVVGEIALANPERHFVLVDVGSGMYLPAANAELKTVRDGAETGRLKVTPERKRPFITADIVNGNPAPGDQVIAQ